MKIAVITANIGGFDSPKRFPEQDIPFDRFYYTEANLPAPMHTQDARMKAKLMKMIPHRFLPQYDVFVWVDGNIQVKSCTFLSSIIHSLQDVSISRHPSRWTIYEEAEYIINKVNSGNAYLSSRYTAESIRQEIESIGPGMDGLYWNGLFARINNPKVNAAFEQWMLENVIWTNFDQLNFVKVATEHDLKLGIFSLGNFYNNDHYELKTHLK